MTRAGVLTSASAVPVSFGTGRGFGIGVVSSCELSLLDRFLDESLREVFSDCIDD